MPHADPEAELTPRAQATVGIELAAAAKGTAKRTDRDDRDGDVLYVTGGIRGRGNDREPEDPCQASQEPGQPVHERRARLWAEEVLTRLRYSLKPRGCHHIRMVCRKLPQLYLVAYHAVTWSESLLPNGHRACPYSNGSAETARPRERPR